MSNKKKEKIIHTLVTLFFFVVTVTLVSCAAFNRMNNDAKISDQKLSSDISVEKAETIEQEINQDSRVVDDISLTSKNIDAETINYAGANWVVVGMSSMCLVFVIPSYLLVRSFIKRGSMLSLLTCAIQKVGNKSPGSVQLLKLQLEEEIRQKRFKPEDKKNIGKFARKKGNFAEQ